MPVHGPALLVVPSQPAIERARRNSLNNALERHSTGNHLRAQAFLDVLADLGAELIGELGLLVSARPADIAGLLGPARAEVGAKAPPELSVNCTPVTTEPLRRLGRAESSCFVALYLVPLIESQLSVSVCHDT